MVKRKNEIIYLSHFLLGVIMGRNRHEEELKRVKVSIRLPKWLVDKCLSEGKITAVIQKALMLYFRKSE